MWAEINSSAIQSIGANTPWYFETKDRAGNTRRSGGSIELKDSYGDSTQLLRTPGSRVTCMPHTFDGQQYQGDQGIQHRNPAHNFISQDRDNIDDATVDGRFTVGETTGGGRSRALRSKSLW